MDKNNKVIESMYTEGAERLHRLVIAQEINKEDQLEIETQIRESRIALTRLETLLPEGVPDVSYLRGR